MKRLAWLLTGILLLGVSAPSFFLSNEAVKSTTAGSTFVTFTPDVIIDLLPRQSKKSDTLHPSQTGYTEIAGTIASELEDFGASN
jgi:lysophospholipase L1-like esterase